MRLALLARKCAEGANYLCHKAFWGAVLPKMPQEPDLPSIYTVAGRDLPLKCVASPRAKRLTLRIEAGGRGLRITMPPHAREADVLDFIRRHHSWLEKRLALLPAAAQAENQLIDGGIIPIFGEPRRIAHCAGRGITHLAAHEGEACLCVYGRPEFIARHIRDFLKKQAEQTLTPLVAKHAAAIGIKPRSISYKDTKSRWGSCSSERRLSFSWRLTMAPMQVIDYLAAHEVAHLQEMNHAPQFWALCERLCPQTQKCRQWLKDNGQKLQAICFDQE